MKAIDEFDTSNIERKAEGYDVILKKYNKLKNSYKLLLNQNNNLAKEIMSVKTMCLWHKNIKNCKFKNKCEDCIYFNNN